MKDFLTLLLGLFLVLAGFKLSNSASSGIMTVLPVILIAAGIAGVIAGIWPARRASKIEVMEALQYE